MTAAEALRAQIAQQAAPADAGHFDELRAGGEQLSPGWAGFFDALGSAGLHNMERRTRELARQVRDNGITYNVYADDNGPQRPWSVSLFPLIIDPTDWQSLTAAVLQRAKLLEKIVADIYGPQQLLRDGLLPAALVHGHPGYLRAMHGVQPAGGRYLHIVALDLARGPDGAWSVISQRTEAPSGLGYLLENRALISYQFPAAYEALHVQPLTDVYRDLIESLKQRSPAGADAHIALLTPGPYNETYFEHAYLARHLGLTLAEGGDLTVRDQRLYLRTLHGLEPVHVLLKRLDDAFLDPLELRADSTLGVPGLMQAVRAGHVIMANAPGSGFLQSPALLGFLPAISEKLLGQTLQMPALDTWWCGERAAMEQGLPHLPQGVIKPTYPGSSVHPSFEPALGITMTQAQRDEWVGRITRQPDAHTLQSYLRLPQMPTWAAGGDAVRAIAPGSYTLRVFALSRGADDWYVLPGGMARIASDNSEIASMQRGGSSADVWVVREDSDRDAATISTPAAGKRSAAARRRVVTSRAGENLFWFGRYTERSENTLRLARLCLQTLNADRPASRGLWRWTEDLAQREGLVPYGVPSAWQEASAGQATQPNLSRRRIFERTLIDYLDRQDAQTSVGYNLRAMKNAASTVRERLTSEQWNTIVDCVNQFSTDYEDTIDAHQYSTVRALAALSGASHALAAITGSQTDRMTRDSGWQLLSIGRHLERLGFLGKVLEMAAMNGLLQSPSDDGSGFDALLHLFDSTITYQAQHQQGRDLGALLTLLVMDVENPRSLAWVARSLKQRLDKLSAGTGHLAALEIPAPDSWSLSDMLTDDGQGGLPRLASLLASCATAAWQISEALSARYFVHSYEHSVE